MRSLPTALLVLMLTAMLTADPASAAVITLPQSALIPSTTYYTDSIGGGIGSPLIMTGRGQRRERRSIPQR